MNKREQAYWSFIKELWSMCSRLLKGMWQLTRLPQPAITIFGSARIPITHPYATNATFVAKRLAENGFSIITGGGPGIMEAANLGAYTFAQQEEKKQTHPHAQGIVTVGIGMPNLNKEIANPYVQQNIVVPNFFARKWLLIRYSVGFIVFPGGFGTANELLEIILLVQTKRRCNTPIVLIGSVFWKPFLDWIQDSALANNMIDAQDLDIVSVTDDMHVAVTTMLNRCPKGIDCPLS